MKTDERKLLWRLLVFAGAIRVAFFLISVNGAGTDGPPRALMAYEWSRHPVWLTPGHWLPLQIWISGSLLWLWNDVWLVPRLVSLAFGIATIWPFYKLVREVFSREVTVAAALLFVLYGLQIYQCSSSGGEPLYFFFVFWALFHQARWWKALEPRSLIFAGLFWIPATLTRHEAWWVAPSCVLLALVRALADERRATLLLPVVGFGALVAAGPAFWMTVCAAVKGDALWILHSSQHTISTASAYWSRPWWYRLAFWPVGLTLSIGPFVLLTASVGIAKAVRERTYPLLLVGYALGFLLPFWTLQMLGNSGVNVRHTLFPGTLLFPFAAFALEGKLDGVRLARWTVAVAGAWLLFVFALGETERGEFSQKFRSISPRAQDRPHVMDAATWVRRHAATGDRAAVDRFNDEESSLQFHVHLPPENVKICWGNPEDLRAFLTPMPKWLIVAPKGPLGQALAASDIPVTPRHSNYVYIVYEVIPSS